MKTVWKFRIDLDRFVLENFPKDGEIIHVGFDPGGTICAWALVEPSQERVRKHIHMAGTGHPIPDEYCGPFLGTVVDGSFVWHFFERKYDKDNRDANNRNEEERGDRREHVSADATGRGS